MQTDVDSAEKVEEAQRPQKTRGSRGEANRTELMERAALLTPRQPSQAVVVADAALKEARDRGDGVRLGEAAIVAAQANFTAGNLNAAERHVETALAAFESAGQSRRLGGAYKLHAMLFISQDKVSLALAAALKSLGYPDLSAKDRMYLYATVAMCFHHLVDLPTGGRVLLEYAWAEAERSGDPQTIAACASRCAGLLHDYACWARGAPNINVIGADRPRLESAEHYVGEAKRFLAICDSHFGVLSEPERSWMLGQKGMVVSFAHGWDEARGIFFEALRHAAHFPRHQMMAHLAAGGAARIAGQWEAARAHLLQARSNPAVNTAHTDRHIAWELSNVFQALGDADAAMEELRLFTHLQTRKTRLASEWITDPDNQRRYGARLELSAAKDLVFGKVQPASLKRAIQFIEKNLSRRLVLEEVAQHANVSTRTLQNLFRTHHGVPASDFIRERRMQRADELLRSARRAVAEVAELCGYSSAANFSRDYRRRFGRAPSSVRGVSERAG